MRKQSPDRETNKRLADILRGAFSGPPTPLKDIPKRNGGPRSKTKRQRPSNQVEWPQQETPE
jgi:hypothetical protein